MNFNINNFFSKCEQIRSFLRICSHLRKKSFMEKFIFCAVPSDYFDYLYLGSFSVFNTVFMGEMEVQIQLAFTCSKLTMKTP